MGILLVAAKVLILQSTSSGRVKVLFTLGNLFGLVVFMLVSYFPVLFTNILLFTENGKHKKHQFLYSEPES